jgi:hypothetical protein
LKLLEQVESILNHVPSARNSDKELLIVYMQKFGMDLTTEQITVFNSMPAFESITRARRIIQEQGRYQASKEVDEIRHEKYKQMRQYPSFVLMEENYPSR